MHSNSKESALIHGRGNERKILPASPFLSNATNGMKTWHFVTTIHLTRFTGYYLNKGTELTALRRREAYPAA